MPWPATPRRRDDAAHVRPGIVHRLDKGTSGVMVVARTAGAREELKAQFQAHSIERAYEAIVVGRAEAQTFSTMHGRHPRDRLRFTTRVSRGKRAVTHVRVLGGPARRHPRRVHARDGAHAPDPRAPCARAARRCSATRSTASLRRDPEVRAVAERLGHQALHARVLGLVHPASRRPIRFEAPPPADFAGALAALR